MYMPELIHISCINHGRIYHALNSTTWNHFVQNSLRSIYLIILWICISFYELLRWFTVCYCNFFRYIDVHAKADTHLIMLYNKCLIQFTFLKKSHRCYSETQTYENVEIVVHSTEKTLRFSISPKNFSWRLYILSLWMFHELKIFICSFQNGTDINVRAKYYLILSRLPV